MSRKITQTFFFLENQLAATKFPSPALTKLPANFPTAHPDGDAPRHLDLNLPGPCVSPGGAQRGVMALGVSVKGSGGLSMSLLMPTE